MTRVNPYDRQRQLGEKLSPFAHAAADLAAQRYPDHQSNEAGAISQPATVRLKVYCHRTCQIRYGIEMPVFVAVGRPAPLEIFAISFALAPSSAAPRDSATRAHHGRSAKRNKMVAHLGKEHYIEPQPGGCA